MGGTAIAEHAQVRQRADPEHEHEELDERRDSSTAQGPELGEREAAGHRDQEREDDGRSERGREHDRRVDEPGARAAPKIAQRPYRRSRHA